jgi:inhibitor of cysteine peptidase
VLEAEATGGVCRVKHDQELEIRLPANPSTGYAWAIADGATMLLEPVGKPTYTASATATPMVGRGGATTFRFRPITMGHDTLRLVYRRPSEPDTPPAREFACDVMVWWGAAPGAPLTAPCRWPSSPRR